MINELTVINQNGDSWSFSLRESERYGIQITNIDGIGSGTADVFFQDYGLSDGAYFTSARTQKRTITITAVLRPRNGLTTEEIRHMLYRIFPLKKQVTLQFLSDFRQCEISGRVEACDTPIFSRSVVTQITIVCPFPHFKSIGNNAQDVTRFYGVTPNFEFPFSNESVDENLIEFSSITLMKENNVHYSGEEDTGVIIHIKSSGDVGDITIYNVTTRDSMTILSSNLDSLTGSKVRDGDEITISTVQNQKYVQLLRDGVYTNILNCLDKGYVWFELSPGDNVFAYEATEGGDALQFEIRNDILYTGV